MQRIVNTGDAPMEVYTMSLTRNGFDFTFTQNADVASATNPINYKIRRYRYEYKKKDPEEGIDIATQIDVQDVTAISAKLSTDGKKVSLTIDGLKPGFIYEVKLGDIKSVTGQPLTNKLICYTLNKLRT